MKSMTETKEYGRTRLWIVALAGLLAACFAFAATAETLPQDTIASEQIEITVADDTPVGSMTNDELAMGYIQKFFGSSRRLLKSVRLARESLTNKEKALYDYLKTGIAEIASGEKNNTKLTISVETALDFPEFSAEELEIDSLYDSDNFLSEEAIYAMFDYIFEINEHAINALMIDSPYDFYWYDKTHGFMSTTPGYLDGDGTIKPSGKYYIGFAVADEYAADASYDESFKMNLIVDSSQYGQSVAPAVENARSIVNRYAGLNNYQRLLGFKNEICQLASYNDEAAQNGSTPYGNPWQLIWVFDGNDDTKVVCEGYAKAFKYLNDQSTTGTASVILTEGTMNGGKHMWNIVTMEDGQNYLVDVTNCDDREDGYVGIGWPDLLFLAGAESGNPDDGYIFMGLGDTEIEYIYDTGLPFSEEQLTISSASYLENLASIPEFELKAGDPATELDAAGTYYVVANQRLTFTGCARNAMSVELQFEDIDGIMEEPDHVDGYTIETSYSWSQAGEYQVVFTAYYEDNSYQTGTFTVDVTSDGPLEDAQIITGLWHEGNDLEISIELDNETEWYELSVTDDDGNDYDPTDEKTGNIIYLSAIEAAELTSGHPVIVKIEQFAVGKDSTETEVTIHPINLAATLRLPDGLLQIDEEAFMNDESITHVIIPEMVSEIASGAFQGCTALRTAEIPADVTGIAEDAFPSSLETIYGYPGSEAETYARNHEISFVRID